MTILLAGRLAAGEELRQGWVLVEGERFAAFDHGDPPGAPDEVHPGIIAPGLIDLQVNGGAGVDVSDGPQALDAIDALQLRHGVTSYLPTLVSRAEADAERALADLAERVADPGSPVAGVHLEGPFLNSHFAGMHPPEQLRAPADGVPAYYFSDCVRLVTLAPELPGALELIAALTTRGVRVALGHSAASWEVVQQAIGLGASLVTHVFNAMAPLDHHRPGLIAAALTDKRLSVGVIADGLHVQRQVLRLIRAAAGARVVLVSDATTAAGAPPGRYLMGGVPIELGDDGRVLTDQGRLAGSALTLDGAVSGWVRLAGATLAEALAAASVRPASVLGLDAFAPGAWADLVLLDEQGAVKRVMRHGRWL